MSANGILKQSISKYCREGLHGLCSSKNCECQFCLANANAQRSRS